MKKLLLIIFLLTVLVSLLLAEDIQLQEITLDELLTEYLSDYKIEKQIQLEGIGRDFAVAKETGEIVAVTKTDEKYIVKMLDLEGECKWSHSFDNIYYDIRAFVSDNGTTTTLRLSRGEGSGKNIIISENGKIMYESSNVKSDLYPSPDGNYVYENQNVMASSQKELKIYDKYGERIAITGLENYQIQDIRIKFVDSFHIIVFIKQEDNDLVHMLFCEFNKGNIDTSWQFDLEKGLKGIVPPYLTTQNLKNSNNIISLVTSYSGSYVFDFNGNILYRYDGLIPPFFYISQYDDLMIDNREKIEIFDKNFIKMKTNNFSMNNIAKHERILSFLRFRNFYLFDVSRAQWHQKKYHSLLYEFKIDKISSINEKFYNIVINGTNFIFAINYEPPSSITILYERRKK